MLPGWMHCVDEKRGSSALQLRKLFGEIGTVKIRSVAPFLEYST